MESKREKEKSYRFKIVESIQKKYFFDEIGLLK
jgi:hypothetical protein